MIKSSKIVFISIALLAGVCVNVNAADTQQGNGEVSNHWRASCQYCHQGTRFAPALLGRGLPAAYTRLIVRKGAPGMPVFHESEISDAELDTLATWIFESNPPASDQEKLK